jgi:hypothetical protein
MSDARRKWMMEDEDDDAGGIEAPTGEWPWRVQRSVAMCDTTLSGEVTTLLFAPEPELLICAKLSRPVDRQPVTIPVSLLDGVALERSSALLGLKPQYHYS